RIGLVYEEVEYSIVQERSDIGVGLFEEARPLLHSPVVGPPHTPAVEIGIVAKADRHPHQGEGDRKAQHDKKNEHTEHQDGNLRIRHRPCPSGLAVPVCLVSPRRSATTLRSFCERSTASSSSTSSICCGH